MLSKYSIFYENGNLVSTTDSVWLKLSQELGGKLNPKSVYLKALKDTDGLVKKLKKIKGFLVSEDESDHSVYHSSDESLMSTHNESERKTFKFCIPYDMYRQIYPEKVIYQNKCKKRAYEVLKQNMWSDVLNHEFIRVHKLPCNFIYKRVKVYNPINSKYILRYEAKCKDECCGNTLIGWSDNKPSEGEPLILQISTIDTRGLEAQHTTKRPLKGNKRLSVGLELDKDLACNWRRNNVSDLEYGRFSPPNLYVTNAAKS